MFKLISHRGNTTGRYLNYENNPKYVENTLKKYDCEIDIRYQKDIDTFFLGHDKSEYEVNIDWLLCHKNNLWIHCKNFDSLNYFVNSNLDLNYFWHSNDEYTITSKGYIWTFPGEKYDKNSVIVDLNLEFQYTDKQFFGVCSDYISKLG